MRLTPSSRKGATNAFIENKNLKNSSLIKQTKRNVSNFSPLNRFFVSNTITKKIHKRSMKSMRLVSIATNLLSFGDYWADERNWLAVL